MSLAAATPTTAVEPPPFAVVRSAFPAAKVAFVVQPLPATVRAEARVRALAREARHDRPATPQVAPDLARWLPVATCAGAFALGAATAASLGVLADRGLEAAALSCVVAGVATLFVALIRRRARARPSGKRRAAGGLD